MAGARKRLIFHRTEMFQESFSDFSGLRAP
jgi:hypothetical protein